MDEYVQENKFSNRSQALRHLVNQHIVEKKWLCNNRVAGAVTLVYDHHKREIANHLAETEREYSREILSVQRYTLNENLSMEVIALNGISARLTELSETMINTSVNQCLSRTVLTSLTTFVVVGVMFVAGGSGIHEFSFSLCVGVLIGTYSSIGVASPLVYRPKTLYTIIPVLVAAGLAGLILQIPYDMVRQIGLGLVVIVAAIALYKVHAKGGSGPATAR